MSNRKDQTEVLIDGTLYNVKDFRHPGGSIIKFLTGNGDATDAFREFHSRSAKAQKLLKSLPSRKADGEVLKRREGNGKPELAKDFAILRQQLVDEGFFEPSPQHTAYRVAEIAVMHLVGALLVMNSSSFLVNFIGLVVLGIAQGRCGWLMHEGGHYSLTANIQLDRAIQIFFYGVGCGMSGMWWRNQHNKHHAAPQKLEHDVDLDTLPLVAFNQKLVNHPWVKASPVLRVWLRCQAYLFIPVSCVLVAVGWQLYLHPRHILRQLTSSRAPKPTPAQPIAEAACLLLRYLVIFGFVLANQTTGTALAYYLTYNLVGAGYIFTNFSLSHTHLPVTEPRDFLHWVEYASDHTTNITSGLVCDWWMAFLNFQIEHHLFPSLPQFRHPLVAPRVQKLFKKHNLTYDNRDYFPCLFHTLKNLDTVGRAAVRVGKDPLVSQKHKGA